MTYHIGFTGTQQGMTAAQMKAVGKLFEDERDWGAYLHHGDCVGADYEADVLARSAGFTIAVHPPLKDDKRAWCGMTKDGEEEDDYIFYAAKDYLDRNCDIVEHSEILVATPATDQETMRSGTWFTIRYARKVGKPYIIVFPDGEVVDNG